MAFFNPYSGPPEGEDGWLADLPAAVRDEYLDDEESPAAAREVLVAGFTHDDHVAGAEGSPPAGSSISWHPARRWPPSPAMHGMTASPCSATMS